jgi:hypothetical protein
MKNLSWTTFDGRIIELGEIDHQHLSNSIWYTLKEFVDSWGSRLEIDSNINYFEG